MSSHKEKLVLPEPPDVVMLACQRAAELLKWRVVAMERMRFQARETVNPSEGLQIPVQIEAKVLPIPDGSGVEIVASSVGFGAAQNQRVEAQAAAFLRKVRFELDRPNMERRQQEAEHERLAQIERERLADERAAMEEAAQRAAARASVMEQLSVGTRAARTEAPAQAEAPRAAIAESPDADLLDSEPEPEYEPAPPRHPPSSYAQLSSKEAPPPPATDLVADLERLSNLHQIGALTEDEFRMAKRKLLRL